MNDTEPESARPRALGLLIAGLVLLVGGGVGALFAKNAAEQDAFGDELFASLQGIRVDVAPDYTGMWVLIIIAALGAVALIVRAASPAR